MLVAELVHLVHLLLALLEAPEVVLDQERGVELADGDLVVAGGRHHLVQQLLTRPLPHLLDHRPKLLVRIVDVTCPQVIVQVKSLSSRYVLLQLLGLITRTQCIDAAYCYRCSMVCVSFYLSVNHNREPYKNG